MEELLWYNIFLLKYKNNLKFIVKLNYIKISWNIVNQNNFRRYLLNKIQRKIAGVVSTFLKIKSIFKEKFSIHNIIWHANLNEPILIIFNFYSTYIKIWAKIT